MSTEEPTIVPQDDGPPLVINVSTDDLMGMLDSLLTDVGEKINTRLDARVQQLRTWVTGLVDIARDALDEGLSYNTVAANIIVILHKELFATQLAEALAILTVDTAEEQRKAAHRDGGS